VGEPAPYLAVATFLSMGVGTLLSASLTRTALILAPAIGIATITQSILKNNALSFRQVLLASVLAGILTLIFALLRTNDENSWRFEILRNIPDEIKLGIKGRLVPCCRVWQFKIFKI
jgi:xanthine/uracil/vitamin C permease (AzgA family)